MVDKHLLIPYLSSSANIGCFSHRLTTPFPFELNSLCKLSNETAHRAFPFHITCTQHLKSNKLYKSESFKGTVIYGITYEPSFWSHQDQSKTNLTNEKRNRCRKTKQVALAERDKDKQPLKLVAG